MKRQAFIVGALLFVLTIAAMQNGSGRQEETKSRPVVAIPTEPEENDAKADAKADAEAVRKKLLEAQKKFPDLEGEVTDYTDSKNWMVIPEIMKDVDTIYFYGSTCADSGKPKIIPADSKVMHNGAKQEYIRNCGIFEESTNVFVPYYRQTNLAVAKTKTTGELEAFQRGIPRTDVYGALDYYFTKQNAGRPFILAGHGQGAYMLKFVLTEYMKENPLYYDRMVAAYLVGTSVTKKDLNQWSKLKFTEKENDTGVIISWNTHGAADRNIDNFFLEKDALVINPLDWESRGSYVSVDQNLFSRLQDPQSKEYKIYQPGVADAVADPYAGAVLTTPVRQFLRETATGSETELFGAYSYHNEDYALFYGNVQKNVKKRIQQFQKEAEKKD